MAYHDAVAIAASWLADKDDLPKDSGIEISYVPPPTFSLFGEWYYWLLLDYFWDNESNSGWTRFIMVHAETGEMLFMRYDTYFWVHYRGDDGSYLRDVTIECLDDWYYGEAAILPPMLLTAEEAAERYGAAMKDRFGGYGFTPIARSPGMYVIFGEPYHYFHAEDPAFYWYNILVHWETGDMLFSMVHDGMYGGQDIMALDDWLDKIS
jgi:hypothetical protein